jgi:hypothetical protein
MNYSQTANIKVFPLYESFVDVGLCMLLYREGLNPITPFKWRVLRHAATLTTTVFDTDNYYVDGQKMVDAIDAPAYFPAFTIGDLQKILPDYLLNKNNNEYELSCSSLFKLDVETSDRMPDVFAKVVIKGLAEYKLQACDCMRRIQLNTLI